MRCCEIRMPNSQRFENSLFLQTYFTVGCGSHDIYIVCIDGCVWICLSFDLSMYVYMYVITIKLGFLCNRKMKKNLEILNLFANR